MIHVGDIMSTAWGVQCSGGYHLLLREYHGGNIMIHVGEYHECRRGVQYHGGTQITKDDIPHSTEPPPPTVLMISPQYHDPPMVLKIFLGTQDIQCN